jgi:outer membrane lipoprotein-sorting protein
MRKLSARWLVPVGIAAIILGTVGATSAIRASAGASLAPRTAAQLLAEVQTASVGSAIGTLVEHADLDIPALPAGIGGDGSAQFDSLITGSHTLRLWYDGPQRERLALIGTLGESDIIRNGTNLWIWSSSGNKVTHVTLPAAPPGKDDAPAPSAMAITPSAIATELLSKLSPTTSVTVGRNTTVADRAAYTLVVAPKDSASLIGSIQIAIDARTHVPLRVQVYPTGGRKTAFEMGFTEINFVTPDPSNFEFNPPPHPTSTPLGPALGGGTMPANGGGPTVIGSGWTTIVAGPMPFVDNGPGGQGDSAIDAISKSLPTVNGPWGAGKLLRTKLFSALLTSDDRIYIGAVTSNSLLAAVTKALGK